MCDGCGADCLAPLRSKKMMKEIEKSGIIKVNKNFFIKGEMSMLTTIVVVILFVVAFCMVVYEWAITLLWGLVAATIVTWIVTVYIEHVMKDLKAYERAYNLFILLRLLTIVLVVALAGIGFLSRLFF